MREMSLTDDPSVDLFLSAFNALFALIFLINPITYFVGKNTILFYIAYKYRGG